jgi:hypothetical protein
VGAGEFAVIQNVAEGAFEGGVEVGGAGGHRCYGEVSPRGAAEGRGGG